GWTSPHRQVRSATSALKAATARDQPRCTIGSSSSTPCTSSPQRAQYHATASCPGGSAFRRICSTSPSGTTRLGTHAGIYTLSPGSRRMRAGSRSLNWISQRPLMWITTASVDDTTKNGCATRLRLRCGIGSVPFGPTGNSSHEPHVDDASRNTFSVFLRSSAMLLHSGALEIAARAVGQLDVLRVAAPAHELGGEALLRRAALAARARLGVVLVDGVGVEAHVGELGIIGVLAPLPHVAVHAEHDLVAGLAAQEEAFVLRRHRLHANDDERDLIGRGLGPITLAQ